MKNEFNLEITSNVECNVYIDNKLLFTLEANSIVNHLLEKGNKKIQILRINSNEELYKIEFVFTENHYKIDIDLISIINTKIFIEELNPIIKDERQKAISDKLIQPNKYSLEYIHIPIVSFFDTFKDDYAAIFYESYSLNDRGDYDSGYQFIDKLGNIASKHIVKNLINLTDGIAVFEIDSKYGFLNLRTDIIYESNYENLFEFKNGLACVKLNDKYGFIDNNNIIIIDFIYDEKSCFNEGIACVKLNDKYGYVNKTNTEILPFLYTKATNFSNNIAKVVFNENNFIINYSGELTRTLDFDSIISWKNEIALVKRDKRQVVIDKNGNEIFTSNYKLDYPLAQCYIEDMLAVYCTDKEKYGFLNIDGKIAIDFIYDYVENFSNGLARVKINSKYGIVDKYGKIIVDFYYDSISDFVDNLACANKNGTYGYIDTNGNIVINFQYEDALNFSEGLACVKKNDKYGFIDKKNNLIVDFQYDNGTSFSEGLACVLKDDKYGFINKTGILVIEHNFIYASNFLNGLASISALGYFEEECKEIYEEDNDLINLIGGQKASDSFYYYDNKDGTYNVTLNPYFTYNEKGEYILNPNNPDFYYEEIIDGFIDKKGKLKLSNFSNDFHFSEGIACIYNESSDSYYYINTEKKFISNDSYEFAEDFSSGLAVVKSYKSDDKYFYINTIGENAFNVKFEDAKTFSDNLACCKKGNRYGYIDNEGVEKISFSYTNAKDFSCGRALVDISEKYGLIDRYGKEVIPIIYDSIAEFIGDFAIVVINDFFGIINKQGELVVPANYQWLEPYSTGVFIGNNSKYSNSGSWGLIDSNENILIPFIFSEIVVFKNKFLKVKYHKKYGLYNDKFLELFPPKFDIIEDFELNLAKINQNGRWGLINEDGKEVLLPQYDKIYDYKSGIARVRLNNDDYNFINIHGNCITSNLRYGTLYSDALDFSNGLAAVKNKESFWGYINTNGEEVIKCQFKNANSFSNDMASVELDHQIHPDDTDWVHFDFSGSNYKDYGYINLNGDIAIRTNYNELNSFNDGLAIIKGIQKIYREEFELYEKYLYKRSFNELAITTYTFLDIECDLPNEDWYIEHYNVKIINKENIELKIRPIVEIFQILNDEKVSTFNLDEFNYRITDITDFYKGYAKIRIAGNWKLIDSQGRYY